LSGVLVLVYVRAATVELRTVFIRITERFVRIAASEVFSIKSGSKGIVMFLIREIRIIHISLAS